jgi:hypothetical protein
MTPTAGFVSHPVALLSTQKNGVPLTSIAICKTAFAGLETAAIKPTAKAGTTILIIPPN